MNSPINLVDAPQLVFVNKLNNLKMCLLNKKIII